MDDGRVALPDMVVICGWYIDTLDFGLSQGRKEREGKTKRVEFTHFVV